MFDFITINKKKEKFHSEILNLRLTMEGGLVRCLLIKTRDIVIYQKL
jgi:hypothetical protein